MDTSVFHYFKNVAECGSISAAARRLFISQPALTKQLGRLEQQLGVKLFERTPLKLTAEGEAFLEFAERYLELENDFFEQISRSRGQEQGIETVSVGTTARGGKFVGDHTNALISVYPYLRPEYLDMSAEACEAALIEERVELIVYTDPVISDKIEYMPIEEDPLIWAVPRNSVLLEGKNTEGSSQDKPFELEIEMFRRPDVNYVLSTPEHSLYYAEEAFFKKYRIKPQNPLRVDFVDTRYSIACSGSGIALIPKTTTLKLVERDRDVVYCTVKGGRICRYVVIARKKGKTLKQGAEDFWRFMVTQRF